jgi:hypothetical protein
MVAEKVPCSLPGCRHSRHSKAPYLLGAATCARLRQARRPRDCRGAQGDGVQSTENTGTSQSKTLKRCGAAAVTRIAPGWRWGAEVVDGKERDGRQAAAGGRLTPYEARRLVGFPVSTDGALPFAISFITAGSTRQHCTGSPRSRQQQSADHSWRPYVSTSSPARRSTPSSNLQTGQIISPPRRGSSPCRSPPLVRTPAQHKTHGSHAHARL